jgi:hypothetical protein
MALASFLARLDRRLARFNEWFGGAAVAANTQPQNQSSGVDPMRVKILVGEIEKASDDADGDRKKAHE